MRENLVAVIGAGECDPTTAEQAHEVGRRLAEAGCVVVTGGLGGVMEAASRGAAEGGGLVLAILPGSSAGAANPHVDVAIATGMGDARNAILANTAAGFVAVGGAYGTLSEIAFALKRGKPVVNLGSWDVDPSLIQVETAQQAVAAVLERLPHAASS